MQPDERLTYKSTPQGDLELHLFRAEAPDAGAESPAIVFFFGGGWSSGTPAQFYPHCRYLAWRGMAALAADYRVKQRHGTSPFECVRDGKSAVRWIRGHAGELGIDPERVAAGGGSAGGHVAAATALCKRIEEDKEDLSVSSRPDALVLFNPVFDNAPDGFGHERVKEGWRDISPLHNIAPGAPPTVVFLGTEDHLVPVATAERYRDLMREAGARCDLHLYEGEGHAFFNYREGENPYYNRTVRATDRFLVSLGYLEGEPTLPAK
jgi:acetyl esterase/lipase